MYFDFRRLMISKGFIERLAQNSEAQSLGADKASFKLGYDEAFNDVQKVPARADRYFHMFKRKVSDITSPFDKGKMVGAACGMIQVAMDEKMDSIAKFCLMSKHLLQKSGFFELHEIKKVFYKPYEEGLVAHEVLDHYNGELAHLQLEIDAFTKGLQAYEVEEFEKAFNQAYSKAFKRPSEMLTLQQEISNSQRGKYITGAYLSERRKREGKVLGTVMGALHESHHSAPFIEGIFDNAYKILKSTGILKEIHGKRIMKHLVQEGRLSESILKKMKKDLVRLDASIEADIEKQLEKWSERSYYLAYQEAYNKVRSYRQHFAAEFRNYLQIKNKDKQTPWGKGSRAGAAFGAIELLLGGWQTYQKIKDDGKTFEDVEAILWFKKALEILQEQGLLIDPKVVADIKAKITNTDFSIVDNVQREKVRVEVLALLEEHRS
ncbi:hypothetical protein CL619_05265 [archaeon]|nr:hypothetical protein [archaeon]|tara:strand:- start:799 stop:2103 length:1305 start_codon:yes stop_codon:yes gene_type:complete